MRRRVQVALSILIFINGIITLSYIFILKNIQIAFLLLAVTGFLGCLLYWFEEISTIYINNRKKGLIGAIKEYLQLIGNRLMIKLKNKTVRTFLVMYAVISSILAILLTFKFLFGLSMLCVLLIYIISLRIIWVYAKKEMGLMNCFALSMMLTCLFIQVEAIILTLNI